MNHTGDDFPQPESLCPIPCSDIQSVGVNGAPLCLGFCALSFRAIRGKPEGAKYGNCRVLA